jgi:hypothetical protein
VGRAEVIVDGRDPQASASTLRHAFELNLKLLAVEQRQREMLFQLGEFRASGAKDGEGPYTPKMTSWLHRLGATVFTANQSFEMAMLSKHVPSNANTREIDPTA